MALKLNSSSGGSVTLQEPTTASNYTLTVPAQTGTVVATDASGNVGIGTNAPTFPLDVRNSNLNVSKFQQTGSFQPVYMTSTTNLSGVMSETGNQNGLLMNSASNYTTLWSGGAERMRIDSSGLVSIRTKGTPTDTDFVFQVYSDSSTGGIAVQTNQTTGRAALRFRNPNGVVGQIETSGSNTSYQTSSDYRLKENIAPMTGALATVSALKPVTYTWKVDGSDGQGFIAHELQEVVPDCVTGEKDAVDADGNPVYQGIDTSFLVATLTAAIQELKAELDTVKTELATLKGQA